MNPMRDLFPHLGPEPVTGREVKPESSLVRDVPAGSPGAREAAYHLALRLMFPEEVLGGGECQECGGEGLHFRDCPKRLSEDEGAEGVWDGRWTNTTTKNGGR